MRPLLEEDLRAARFIASQSVTMREQKAMVPKPFVSAIDTDVQMGARVYSLSASDPSWAARDSFS